MTDETKKPTEFTEMTATDSIICTALRKPQKTIPQLRHEYLPKLIAYSHNGRDAEFCAALLEYSNAVAEISRTFFPRLPSIISQIPDMSIPLSQSPLSKYATLSSSLVDGSKRAHFKKKNNTYKTWINQPKKFTKAQVRHMFLRMSWCGFHTVQLSDGPHHYTERFNNIREYILTHGTISNFYKYVFESHYHLLVHIPKTAGTSLVYQLNYPISFVHMPSCFYPPQLWHRLVVFVRNPYDRAVSVFRYIHTRPNPDKTQGDAFKVKFPTFRSWVVGRVAKDVRKCLERACCRRGQSICLGDLNVEQYRYVYNISGRMRIIPDCRIGRFETIQTDCRRLFLMDLHIFNNKSSVRPWQSYYNDGNQDLAQIVYDTYKRDFAEFKYSSDIIIGNNVIFRPRTETTDKQ